MEELILAVGFQTRHVMASQSKLVKDGLLLCFIEFMFWFRLMKLYQHVMQTNAS